ncbi:MAG TPA: hypothetical protein VGH28_02365 [Polyangiaceae bacterium]|jgi:hypothetical protein
MPDALLRRTRAFLTALPREGELPLREVLAFHLDALRHADPEVVAALPTKGPLEHVLAREHGFTSWDEAIGCERIVDARFEAAANAIVEGDLATLRGLLAAHPTLVRARSPYGHCATLLHHVAANGVEVARQWHRHRTRRRWRARCSRPVPMPMRSPCRTAPKTRR